MQLQVVLFLVLLVVPTQCGRLRTLSKGDPEDFDLEAKKGKIKEKWDKADKFLKAIFGIGCKWKHTKDIDGPVAEMVKDDEIAPSASNDNKRILQAEGVKKLKAACGSIVGTGTKECRQGCADRFGNKMMQRAKCDASCVEAYSKFEAQCEGKAENLESVYDLHIKVSKARDTCYNGHCSHLPTVWLKEKGDAQEDEVDKRCKDYCKEKNIEMRCEESWNLEVDFKMAKVDSKCAEEAGVTDCFKDKEDDLDEKHDTCKDDGKDKCKEQSDECEEKGKEAKEKGMKEVCKDRKEMCENQVDENCKTKHKGNLGKAEKKCKKEGEEDYDKCKKENLEKMEKEFLDKCKDERKPKCKDDCHSKCEVKKMNKCLDKIKMDDDPAEMFCDDLWNLLHRSSEVDPLTGMPIVLLQ